MEPEEFQFTNCIGKRLIIEIHSKKSFFSNVLCRKRWARPRRTLRTVSGPYVTTDIITRVTDNENHAGIDISKEFSPMKPWFGLSISVDVSVLGS
jgi:hypothetical protein